MIKKRKLSPDFTARLRLINSDNRIAMSIAEIAPIMREEWFLALGRYIEKIIGFDPLTTFEISELVKKVSAGDKKAREKLFIAHLLMASRIAIKWLKINNRRHPLELIDSANHALSLAILYYKNGAPYIYDAFAVWYINCAVQQSLCKNHSMKTGGLEEKIYKADDGMLKSWTELSNAERRQITEEERTSIEKSFRRDIRNNQRRFARLLLEITHLSKKEIREQMEKITSTTGTH